MTYFNTRLYPNLKQHVIDPLKNGKIKSDWTNNNSESANHMLKSATNWKNTDLPKFVNMLQHLVSSEQKERCRALRDKGNFRLAERFVHHLVDIDNWASLSENERSRRTKRFLSDSGKIHKNMFFSRDGKRTAVKTPSAGRKPKQVKGNRAQRTRTQLKY